MDHSTASEIVKWLLVSMLALGALLSITGVGKPRKPLTGGTVAVIVMFNAAYIIGIVLLWGTR